MVLALCLLAAFGYWLGGRRPLRLLPPARGWRSRQWRATAFAAGLAIVATIGGGPLDQAIAQRIWLRTAQLIVLMTIAAPLLVIGGPWPRIARLLGQSSRGAATGSRRFAILSFALFNGLLLAGYLPAIYGLTGRPGLAQQTFTVVLVVVSVIFWAQVIAQPPRRCALNHVERVAYLVLSSVVIRMLGLVLGFASTAFYGTSLIDQQIAAGILLVPGVLTDLVVLTACLYIWLGQEERKPAERFDNGGRTLPVAPEVRRLVSR